MFASLRRIFPLALLTITVALFALSAAVPAFADDITGTFGLTGGNLTMAAVDPPVLALTLNGSNQTISDTFDIDVKDLTGSGAGWKLTITSTTFTDGTNTLAPGAAKIIAPFGVACDSGDCTLPTNGIGYPLNVPDDAAPTPVTLFSAAAATGLGDFTLTPTFQLSVPANAFAGNYTSTITIDVASGPS